ncbi:hypothetical protein LX15_003721 [Streptoalloteichus tenebrarius]|uniref:Uncharacterized protein n=1 Tax=Streptoalloteichus tenebrarius (strain ATCC 17920 / DSM 40477 / JCM 4838 / CBS 697.72 / NBRC 16177 / NCIMB 11028 / NRRL B-12390 / A12253. 1 / ISP 5477) TaxID=1933 RepID=A0ABT1HWW0_STRSD|nr:hypothetical protein [Streptoalloteichus tenebrarius]MCP2260010.1 hypothetical protein [Streptoalloteichus tenebrarius]BFF03877.1 hypothetical protein GCM10020241_55520 [Streptoalloteichus tenebrarius]
MIQFVTFGALGAPVSGLVAPTAWPMAVQSVSSELPRHALRERGHGLSLADLLRRDDVRRPRRSRKLTRLYAEAPTETLRRIENPLDRLRRTGVAGGGETTVPFPAIPRGRAS